MAVLLVEIMGQSLCLTEAGSYSEGSKWKQFEKEKSGVGIIDLKEAGSSFSFQVGVKE